LKEANSEDVSIVSEADKAHGSDKKGIFNRYDDKNECRAAEFKDC
jgi:hypothetical protein